MRERDHVRECSRTPSALRLNGIDDLVKCLAQALSALRIDHAHKCDSAAQRIDEMRMPRAVLARDTLTSRVVQDRTQGANLLARNRWPFVHGDAGHFLMIRSPHHARLRRMFDKSF